jgi:hypothetical protein
MMCGKEYTRITAIATPRTVSSPQPSSVFQLDGLTPPRYAGPLFNWSYLLGFGVVSGGGPWHPVVGEQSTCMSWNAKKSATTSTMSVATPHPTMPRQPRRFAPPMYSGPLNMTR